MKKILTKITVLVLAICLSGAVSLFAGCVGGGQIDYEHTIIFYTSQGDNLVSVTQNAINAFEAKYPGWKVEHTQPGGYDEVKDKIVSDLQVQTQPDLAYCYPDHVAQYLQTGKVVDLNKYLDSTDTAKWTVTNEDGTTQVVDTGKVIGYTEAELSDFVSRYYEEGIATNFTGYDTYGYTADAMLTLPFVKSTELMYYNADALKACGLQPATTWDELWAQCDTIKKRFPTATPLGYDSEANWFITMCEQNGWGYTSIDPNNHYLFNGPEQAAWLTKLSEYYEKGYFTTQEDYGAYTSALFTKGVEDGGLVYCIGSSGGASHQDPGDVFTWGVAPIPGSVLADGTVNKSVISQGPSLVMLTGGNNVSNPTEKEIMTFMFIKELLDPKFQASFSTASGYNAARLSADEVEAFQEFIESGTIVATAVKTGLTMREDFFVSPAFNGSSTARLQVGNVIVYAMRGEKTPEQALADAYKNCGGK